MKVIYGVVLSIIAFSIEADECSNLVDGYLDGLRTGALLTATDKENMKNAQEQIDHILKIREHKSDCFIVETIPSLKASRDAVGHAVKSTELNCTGSLDDSIDCPL